MKNKNVNLKAVIIGSLVCIAPVFLGMAMWNSLPDKLPAHWNVTGEIDIIYPKWVVVFIMPLVLALLNIVCHVVSAKRNDRERYAKVLNTMTYWIIPVISIVVCSLSLLVGKGVDVKVEIIMPALLSAMLIFIGNYMPKCKQNHTMGIKLPWTLKSDENWRRTHSMAGKTWVLLGFVSLIVSFFGLLQVSLAVVFLAVAAPLVYSFVLHKKGI